MKKKLMFLSLLFTIFAGCSVGPCYQAMKYRKAAETAQGTEKAALLGKADAIQKQCDDYNTSLQESQKRTAINKSGN
jgi:hypothetical protein